MIVWIFFISAVCTLIYSIIEHDYLQHDAMWAECFFPGVVIWNKLGERGCNKIGKIVISSILSVVLFTYTLVIVTFLICLFIIYTLEGLTKRLFKKKQLYKIHNMAN